jgi:rhodanese-related sulfurtransferase
MTGREFKDIVFQQFASMAQAFSSPKRLEIIDILAQGERDVETLAKLAAMTVANTSRHLQILKSARLVKSRQDGVRVFYSPADDEVVNCWKSLQRLAEKRNAEIKEIAREFFEAREALEPISRKELLRRIKNHDATILDVRPVEEYESAHIAGAISIPLPELKKRLKEIPKDREVVAYCRGPYCVLSAEAVVLLRNAGYKVIRLEDGVHEWKRAGLPTKAGHNEYKEYGYDDYHSQ